MARRGTNLPKISNNPYETENQGYGQFRSGRSPPVVQEIVPYTQRESRGPSRLDILEERLVQQERNTHALVDRAFKIKEDVIDSLNFTHGTWQEEKHARNMLQEHIKTITAIVNKLNADISALDDQLRHRDNATVGTNNAVKNLEVHHVASLTDLRGRIVRCDTSISKLSTDLRGNAEQIKQMNATHQDSFNKIMDRLHGLESKIVQVNNQMDKTNSESRIKIQHLEGDTGQQISMMDGKTRQLVDELKNQMHIYQTTADGEREKLEGRLYNHIDKISQAKDTLIEKVERRLDETHYVSDARLQKLEEGLLEERARISELQHHIESKLMTKLDAHIRHQAEEFSRLKRETREGFSTVHESISNMKTVMEGKRKLLEDQLRKEIGQIRKMVVLV